MIQPVVDFPSHKVHCGAGREGYGDPRSRAQKPETKQAKSVFGEGSCPACPHEEGARHADRDRHFHRGRSTTRRTYGAIAYRANTADGRRRALRLAGATNARRSRACAVASGRAQSGGGHRSMASSALSRRRRTRRAAVGRLGCSLRSHRVGASAAAGRVRSAAVPPHGTNSTNVPAPLFCSASSTAGHLQDAI